MTTTSLLPAVSLDEYIERKAPSVRADDLRNLRKHIGALRAKLELAESRGHDELVKGVELLMAVLESPEVARSRDPLPASLAEAGVAAVYLLKGIDIIPDSIPDIGLADDEWIVARVIARNPTLRAVGKGL